MHAPLSRRDLFRLSDAPDRREIVHIASLLLQVMPARVAAVREAVAALPSAEFHPTGHPGKFAVVLEAADERALAQATETLTQLQGVLTVSIVAHLTEDAATLDEQMPDVEGRP